VLPAVPSALSVMVRVPGTVPVAWGEKVTLIWQVPAAGTLAPQVFVWAKFAEPAVMAMLEIASAVLLVLCKVTACAALVSPTATPVKLSEVGETETVLPIPVRLTVCGLPLALSLSVRVPVRLPVAVGVKVTLTVQTPLAEIPVPQVLVSAKSPVIEIPEKVSAAVPELVTVIDCAALVLATNWPEKVSEPGESDMEGVPAGGVVLLDPPPQATRSANPVMAKRPRNKYEQEDLISSPPESDSRARD
jgi:hypothetical protein